MNRVILIGRLTKKPEYKQVKDKSVATFRLAVDRQGEDADFIPIVVWNKQADNVNKYLDKGSKVAVEGRIQTSTYGDKKIFYTTEVIASQVWFLDNKPKEEEKDPYKELNEELEQMTIEEDKLPF